MKDFWTTAGLAAALVTLSFVGIGLGVLLGKRKDIKGCSCGFDADRERACAAARRAGKAGDLPAACDGCAERPGNERPQ